MRCFVMMPVHRDFESIRTDIRNAATRVQVECIWADEMYNAGRITEQIIGAIRESHLCIADVTGRNANVAWELGFASALQRPIVILAQSSADRFFDLADQRAIIYEVANRPVTLIQPLTAWLERLRNVAPTVPPEDLLGTTKHERMTYVLGAKRVPRR